MKNKLKRFAADAEIGAVRSIMKWAYKKKGKGIPSGEALDRQSRRTVSLANDTVKTVWRDLKAVYEKDRTEKDDVGKEGSGRRDGNKGGMEE